MAGFLQESMRRVSLFKGNCGENQGLFLTYGYISIPKQEQEQALDSPLECKNPQITQLNLTKLKPLIIFAHWPLVGI